MTPAGVLQVREGAAAAGVLLGGENALPCFVPGGVDQYALDRIVYNTKPWSPPLQVSQQLVFACRRCQSQVTACTHQSRLIARICTVAAPLMIMTVKRNTPPCCTM